LGGRVRGEQSLERRAACGLSLGTRHSASVRRSDGASEELRHDGRHARTCLFRSDRKARVLPPGDRCNAQTFCPGLAETQPASGLPVWRIHFSQINQHLISHQRCLTARMPGKDCRSPGQNFPSLAPGFDLARPLRITFDESRRQNATKSRPKNEMPKHIIGL
jgi:hypothetical protein